MDRGGAGGGGAVGARAGAEKWKSKPTTSSPPPPGPPLYLPVLGLSARRGSIQHDTLGMCEICGERTSKFSTTVVEGGVKLVETRRCLDK